MNTRQKMVFDMAMTVVTITRRGYGATRSTFIHVETNKIETHGSHVFSNHPK